MSIAEIGAAAGITGSGVYRHFGSKSAILVALFDQVIDDLLNDEQRILAESDDLPSALAQLVAGQVEFVVGQRQLAQVYHNEVNNLPDEDRRRLRRKQRLYLEEWVHLVNELRGELSDTDSRAIVHATIGRASFEVDALQQDEQRLGKLIETLARRARLAAAREAARREAEQREAERRAAAQREAERREAAQREAERRAARARAEHEQRGETAARAEPAPVPRLEAPPPARVERAQRPEPVVGEVRDAASATPTGVRFNQLRGQLRFPVRGELVGRFGAPRAEGGTTWKGVFIRAGNGAEVRSVAGGEVVFSDWLRGYGNLIIVDHGSDYLTIYGNNDSLLKEVGDRVGGGEPIASVGAAGVGNDSGLYFEIRHQGQPLDPMQWMRLN